MKCEIYSDILFTRVIRKPIRNKIIKIVYFFVVLSNQALTMDLAGFIIQEEEMEEEEADEPF